MVNRQMEKKANFFAPEEVPKSLSRELKISNSHAALAEDTNSHCCWERPGFAHHVACAQCNSQPCGSASSLTGQSKAIWFLLQSECFSAHYTSCMRGQIKIQWRCTSSKQPISCWGTDIEKPRWSQGENREKVKNNKRDMCAITQGEIKDKIFKECLDHHD